MIITINGAPGSGKSTVAKKLAKKLGYEQFYGGGFRREEARAKGMTLAEFNEWSKNHIEGDTNVDQRIVKLAKEKKDKLIIDSRTAWHFIPHSFKIYLHIDTELGAKRIWSSYAKDAKKRNEDHINSLDELIASVTKRFKIDVLRYKKHYKINILDKNNYDLWLDVGNLDKKQEFAAVYKAIKIKLDTA